MTTGHLRRFSAAVGTWMWLMLAAGGRCPAQEPGASAGGLPTAPSAILTAEQRARRDESLTRPAGSGLVFRASAMEPGPGGLSIEEAKDVPLELSLDDAIALGLERNVRLKYDVANERSVRGLTLSVVNALVPNLKVNGEMEAQEIDLAAMGFKPALFAKFASTGLIPAGYSIPLIVKVNTAQANLSLNQTLFNMTDFELFKGTKNETKVVDLTTLDDRGDVILAVAQTYLTILADEASEANAKAQEVAAETLLGQARAKQDAGVGVHLDTLRAQVEYQQRQQDTVRVQNQLAKDKIQLARIMGIPAGQQIELTDKAPYDELAMMDLDEAKVTAYEHRKDFLMVEEEIQLNDHVLRAVKFQRLPTLAFNGYYGVIGVVGANYHGNFSAAGNLSFPVFNEASQRGQQEVADAQLTALKQRETDLRVTIDAQIRSSMLDVQSSQELVQVAESNVGLAKQALSDATERFKAGVDDNLAAVDAEATLASAEAQLVQSLFRYNVAKLQLARSTGVIESRYRTYLTGK